jgi:hypothetical protein
LLSLANQEVKYLMVQLKNKVTIRDKERKRKEIAISERLIGEALSRG